MDINYTELKAWIAALDSGEYKQGHCGLQTNIGHCCIGVGCRATIPDKLLDTDKDGRLHGGLAADQPAAPLWLVDVDNDFCQKTGHGLLCLNDDLGFTFPEIATLLELVYVHKILD